MTASHFSSLVREALAEHFVAEVLGDAARGPFGEVLNRDQARSLWREVYRHRIVLQGEENTNPYQFGGGTSGLPRWAGYSVGYHVVDWYWTEHPDLSMSGLSRLDAENFVPGE